MEVEMHGGSGDGLNVGSAPLPHKDGIEVRVVDQEIGRGVFATRSFKKGETVFTDTPIVTCQFAWNQLYLYKACEYCLRALETAEENARRLSGRPIIQLPHPECCETQKELHVPCDECDAVYCCNECKEKAWVEYHSVLCCKSSDPPETHPIKVLDLYWRMMHYPPETASIFLLVKLLVKLYHDTDGTLRQRISEFCSVSLGEDEVLAHKMLGDEHITRIINLREMVKNVISFENVQDFLTPEAFLQLFVLVGRNGQGVGTSSFAAWVENIENLEIDPDEKKEILDLTDGIYEAMDGHVGHFMDNEGSALYPLQSLVNHSCVANTVVKFPDRNHVVGLEASEDIAEGEEITISYLDLKDLARSRYSRNKFLKEHYLFECNCPKCLEQGLTEEEVTSDESDSCCEDEEEEDPEETNEASDGMDV